MENLAPDSKTNSLSGSKIKMLHKLSLSNKKGNMLLMSAAVVVVLFGVATGWVLSGSSGLSFGKKEQLVPGSEVSDTEAGITDESTFKDTATGILEAGGIDGEGTHTLKQNDDPSKDVALTSTIIDLDAYVGKKIQVWGQTLSAQKASWLMDVGKLRKLD